MSEDDSYFRLRLKQAIKDWLRSRSAENHRSITGEINLILEREMRNDEAQA